MTTHDKDGRSGLILGALALGLLGSAATPQGVQFPTTPTLPPSAPPPALWQEEVPTTRFGADIYRDLQVRTLDKIVSLEWRQTTVLPPLPVVVKSQASEVFATRYWPTRVVPMDDFHVCVAGRSTSGRAVLERWTFGTHTALGTPAPGVTVAVPTGGGDPHTTWTLPPRMRWTRSW